MGRIPTGTIPYVKGLVYYASPDVRGSSTRDVFKPQAITYNNHVYFTWVDYAGNILITKFRTNSPFGESNLIATKTLDYPTGSDIEHSVPTMCVDNDGYIYVFYGAHDSANIYFRRSTNPEDVTLWNSRQSITQANLGAYPFPVVTSDNKIWVFYRESNGADLKRLSYVTSTDGGGSWSSETDLLIPSTVQYWVYPMAVAVGTDDSVHVFSAVRTGVGFTDTNYMYTENGGTTWKKRDGSSLSVPIDETEADVLVSGSGYPGDMKLNSLNQPYMCYTTSGGGTKFAKWTGSAWEETAVSTHPESYVYEHCEIDIVSDSIIDIYNVSGTDSSVQGGDIKRYRSTNSGTSFSLAESITTNATTSFRYYFPKVVKDHDANCKLIYMAGVPVLTYSPNGTQFSFRTYP